MAWIVENVRIFDPDGVIRRGEVAVDGGRIVDRRWHTEGERRVDGRGGILVPGFVELHIHGLGGVDCSDGRAETLSAMSRFLPRYGVTGFLPTVMTLDLDFMGGMTNLLAGGVEQPGARILGLHMEGPFISPAFKAVMDPRYLALPSPENVRRLLGAHPEQIAMITLAPELPGALEMARSLPDICFSAGHSDASAEQARAAFDGGITHVTHLFNAMRPMHHREPGILGAALTDSRVTCQLICDFVHIHPDMLRLALAMKGPKRICLVSDSMMAAGLGDGDYTLGGQRVFVRNGQARIEGGRLAGSTLTLDAALRNLVSLGWPLEKVLPMLTSTPAREAGLAGRGSLEVGNFADMVLLNDDLTVEKTWVEGRLCYEKNA